MRLETHINIGDRMKKMNPSFLIGIIMVMAVFASLECNETNKRSIKLQSDDKPFIYATLWSAAEAGDLDDVIRHLARGANANDRDPSNPHFDTPLLIALGSIKPNDSMSLATYTAIIKCLVDNGANLNQRCSDSSYDPPPLSSASGLNITLVKYFIEKGADVNGKSTDGETPLHTASVFGHLEIIKYLLEKGSEINNKNKSGITPLHNAASFGHYEAVKYLIDKGADINAINQQGETPLDNAFDPIPIPNFGNKKKKSPVRDYSGIVKLLKERGGKLSAKYVLFESAAEGNLNMVKYQIENGINVDVKSNLEQTPLAVAVNLGNLDIVKYLIDKGANVNTIDYNKHTPLFCATILKPITLFHTKKERMEILHILKANGAEFREGEIDEWNEQQRMKE
jgi:FOG: Ankyrin repeat